MILSWAPWVACANASQLPTSPPPPPLFSGTAPCHLSVLESPGDLQHALTNPTYMATFPWQRLGCAWTFSCNSPLGRKTVCAWPKPHRHPWKIPLSSAIDSGHNQIASLLPIEPFFFGGGQCFLKCYLIAKLLSSSSIDSAALLVIHGLDFFISPLFFTAQFWNEHVVYALGWSARKEMARGEENKFSLWKMILMMQRPFRA